MKYFFLYSALEVVRLACHGLRFWVKKAAEAIASAKLTLESGCTKYCFVSRGDVHPC